MCLDPYHSIGDNGAYTGHDEPTVQFSSHRPGTGGDLLYYVKLPIIATVKPKQDGTGGTWDFQRRATFWFSITMCDTESSPNFTKKCTPNSDANARFRSADPHSPHYLGKAPGSAFMELQFYGPGWVPQFDGFGCTATKWCANLTIDSLSDQDNTGIQQNADCLNNHFLVGEEPINWAYVTKSGKSLAPANPLSLSDERAGSASIRQGPALQPRRHPARAHARHAGRVPDRHHRPDHGPERLDDGQHRQRLRAHPVPAQRTTATSLRTPSTRCTTRRCSGARCGAPITPTLAPPTRSVTSSTATRSTRRPVRARTRARAIPSSTRTISSASTARTTRGCSPIIGCVLDDGDFDGPSYQNTWPGTFLKPRVDRRLHGTAFMFTPPSSNGKLLENVSFENDLPRIERGEPGNHQPGVRPRSPARTASTRRPEREFYPIYTLPGRTAAAGSSRAVRTSRARRTPSVATPPPSTAPRSASTPTPTSASSRSRWRRSSTAICTAIRARTSA